MQTTNHLLMIRPVDFKFNEQTAGNNKFQQFSARPKVQEKALTEFDGLAALLRKNEIEVIVVEDTLKPETPDSIFPNNWISFHHSGDILLYPMFSENRRLERREDIISAIKTRFSTRNVIDLTSYENENKYLEGTGSMVLDRENKIAYACLSSRTDEEVLHEFSKKTGYRILAFNAADKNGFPIYHTNVMMCIGRKFTVICLPAISSLQEKEKIRESLASTGKELIEISLDQMYHFAGNMLEVENKNGQSLLVMSEQAYLSLDAEQIKTLEKYSKLIYAPLYTIEQNGGGSARCMLAEIHLPML